MRGLLVLSVLLCAAISIRGQFYTNMSGLLGTPIVQPESEYGNGVSFCDVNNDGRDDLTFAMSGDSIQLLLNTGSGFYRMNLVPNTFDAKQVLWADYDNDGDQDLLVTSYSDAIRLYHNSGSLVLVDVTAYAGLIQNGNAETFGAAWGDYDGDGWLDLYVCNYNDEVIPNWLFRNNGNGTFSEVGALLGADNGTTFSFQPTFADMNMDGLPDIFVINDKPPLDAMLIQQPNGTFEDIAAGAGFDYYINSMTNSVADYDNDGDLDIYITNLPPLPNYLFRNNGDLTFTDVSAAMGTQMFQASWGAVWVDVDNDQLRDLYVTNWYFPGNSENEFFHALPGGGFDDEALFTVPAEHWFSHCVAKGDYNMDGYPDIALTNREGEEARFYRNNGGSNFWIKVRLQGTVSNRDGVGSLIEWWTNGQRFIEYTMCGENYLTQNSRTYILPLGTHNQCDSLRITWRSGIVDNFGPLQRNQTYMIQEGQTLAVELSAEPGTMLCPGDSLVVHANGPFTEWAWSTGSDSSSTVLYDAGAYWLNAVSWWGTEITSDTLVIQAAPPFDAAAVVTPVTCHGEGNGSIALLSPVIEVAWSDGSFGSERVDLAPGFYEATITDTNYCIHTWSATILEPEQLAVWTDPTDVSCFGGWDGSLAFSPVTGGTGPYSLLWGDVEYPDEESPWLMPGLVAGSYDWTIQDGLSCQLSGTDTIFSPEPLVLSLEELIPSGEEPGSAVIAITGGTPPYLSEWSNDSTGLASGGLLAGEHSVTVTDANGCSEVLWVSVPLSIAAREGAMLRPEQVNGRWYAPQPGCAAWETRDSGGRLVSSGQGGDALLPPSALGGVYIVRLIDRSGQAFVHRICLLPVR